jgi:hypothetical protein
MARKQFLLRIDPELWQELEKWAADDLRSVNAQIEWLLRDSVRRRRGRDVKQAQAKRTTDKATDDDQLTAAGEARAKNRSDEGLVPIAEQRSTVRGGRL